MIFSIITCTFNSQKYVRKSILSALNQSFEDFEVIIKDNNSKDDTADIVEKTIDNRCSFHSSPDLGIYDALNQGISLASGDYIIFLHSDDRFYSNDVLRQLENHISQYKSDIILSPIVFVDRNFRVARRWDPRNFSRKRLFLGLLPPHTGVVVKRSVFSEIGLFDVKYKIAGDTEWLLRALTNSNLTISYSSQILISMSLGGVSTAGLKSELMKLREDYMASKGKFLAPSLFVAGKKLSKLKQLVKGKRLHAD